MASRRGPASLLMLGLALLPSAALATDADSTLKEEVQAIASGNLLVATMAEKMQVAAVAHCTRHMRISGLIIFDRSQFTQRLNVAFAEQLGLGELPTIVSVVADSPAAKAGVQPGDQIVAVNGQNLTALLPSTRSGQPTAQRFLAIRNILTAAFNAGPARLSLLRAGKPLDLAFSGDLGCAAFTQIDASETRNATSDGLNITVNWGIFHAVQNDDQLAFVIAHELAHNILGHREYLDSVHAGQGVFAGLGKNGARIRQTEREADYWGVFLVAWAGYDPHAAAAFWRHIARANPLGFLSWDGMHPGSGERERVLEAEADDLDRARTAGQQLTPDYAAFEARQGG